MRNEENYDKMNLLESWYKYNIVRFHIDAYSNTDNRKECLCKENWILQVIFCDCEKLFGHNILILK